MILLAHVKEVHGNKIILKMWLSRTKIRLYASFSQFIRSERKLNKKKSIQILSEMVLLYNLSFIFFRFFLIYILYNLFQILILNFLKLTNLNS